MRRRERGGGGREREVGGGGGGGEEEGERWRRTAEKTTTGAKPHGSLQSWSKKSRRSNNRKRLFVLTPLSELPSGFTPGTGGRKDISHIMGSLLSNHFSK